MYVNLNKVKRKHKKKKKKKKIFASCHLCKLVHDYNKYRNSFNIIRCENNSKQRQH